MAPSLASRHDVARLFARAAFGATAADLDAWTGKPYEQLVDHLLDVPVGAPLQGDDVRRGQLESTAPAGKMDGKLGQAQTWWLDRMRTTAYPLLERMTLLWHDHFATAPINPYPDLRMLLAQNQTLRTHALGSFADLALAMNTDPAMLYWLDGYRSTPPQPNENYGRELMELFILGKHPQAYSETDVREAARMLTGWTVNPQLRTTAFKAARHDAGTKKVLGRTFRDEGAQEHIALTRHLLDQPTARRFIAWKMVRGLAFDPGASDQLRSPDRLVRAVADALGPGWDIRAALRTLLMSPRFRAPNPSRLLVRQPVEVAVALSKIVGVSIADARCLAALGAQGQRLFSPPGVGGWPTGLTWLSPASLLARYDVAVTAGTAWQKAAAGVGKATLPAPDDIAGWTSAMGLAAIDANTDAALRQHLAATAKQPVVDRQIGNLVLLATSPDWTVV